MPDTAQGPIRNVTNDDEMNVDDTGKVVLHLDGRTHAVLTALSQVDGESIKAICTRVVTEFVEQKIHVATSITNVLRTSTDFTGPGRNRP